MPVQHDINDELRLIITTWSGEATDRALIDALSQYIRDIKSRHDYCAYDEIVDFTYATDFSMSTEGIRKLAFMAARNDCKERRTRLAIVVPQSIAYGLARMYEIYRNLVPSMKEVRVFRAYGEAVDWMKTRVEDKEKKPC